MSHVLLVAKREKGGDIMMLLSLILVLLVATAAIMIAFVGHRDLTLCDRRLQGIMHLRVATVMSRGPP